METTKTKPVYVKLRAWLGLSQAQSGRFTLLLLITLCAVGLAAMKLHKQYFSGALELSVQDTALLIGSFAVLLTAGALGIAWIYRKSESRWQALVFFQVFCLGLLLRFLLLPSPFALENSDTVNFLQPWCAQLRQMPIRQALIADVGNYMMPYRMFLAVVSHTPFTDVFCIKLLSVLCDAGIALMLWLMARQLLLSYGKQLAVFALALLIPTFWLNSAFWAQCDSLYTLLCLAALYCGMRHKGALCWLLGGVALSVKLQAAFLLPALLILCLCGRIRWRSCVLYPLGVIGMNLPALLLGCPLSQIVGIYTGQAGSAGAYLQWNATTFWTLFPMNLDETIGLISLVFSGALLALFFYLFVDRMPKLDDTHATALLAIATLATIYLLPGMHERYFYLAEALMILYAVCVPKNAWAAGVLVLADFTRYMFYLWPEADNLEKLWQSSNKLETASSVFSAEVQAVLLGITILWIIAAFYRETGEKLQKNNA